MACRDLQGITNMNCDLVKGGISNIWMIPFDTIDQYTYTNDNLNRVTGYSTSVLPTLYRPNPEQSEYTGNKSTRDYKLYDHTLSLVFSKMDESKRAELIKLESLQLTVIFEAITGECWIMGQDTPCTLNTVQVGTGTSEGDSTYTIEITSTEKQHIREIQCPSIGCFASFRGTEANRTTFTIPISSNLGWDILETDINGTIVSIIPTQPLDPTDWSDPAILAHDRSVLLTLFSSLGATVDTLGTTYNAGTDVTTITIDSPDSAYGTLQVDNTVYDRSGFFSLLNLTTVISPGLANASTVIQVSDSNGVLYSGGYGTVITGVPNVLGTTDDAVIIASSLYSSSTVLTVTLTNVPCSTVSYTYNYINTLQACGLSRTHEFSKGQLSSIVVPTPTAERFQNVEINIFGRIFTLYTNFIDWHSDYSQFQTDVQTLFNQVSLPIDSLTFTDNTTDVTIEFTATDNPNLSNPFYSTNVRSFDINTSTSWTQSRVVNIDTIGPIGSTIAHSSGSNTIDGENFVSLNAPVGFRLGFNPTSNLSIEDVSLVWAFDTPFNENSTLTTESTGGNCNTADVVGTLRTCYDSYTSTSNTGFQSITLDCNIGGINAGNRFSFTVDGVVHNVTYPYTVTPNRGSHFLCNTLNSFRGIQVIHYEFHPLERQYVIYLELEPTVSLTSVVETTTFRSFTLSAINQVYHNQTNEVNPFILFDWTLPALSGSIVTGDINQTVGFISENSGSLDAVSVEWDLTNDQFSFGKQFAANTLTSYSFTLHENYPTATNQVWSGVLPAGVSNIDIANVENTLIANGSSLAAVSYLAYTNYIGWRYVFAVDVTLNDFDFIITETTRRPNVWGTPDNIKYISSTPSAAPTVTSNLC